jgi:hypothetical protein
VRTAPALVVGVVAVGAFVVGAFVVGAFVVGVLVVGGLVAGGAVVVEPAGGRLAATAPVLFACRAELDFGRPGEDLKLTSAMTPTTVAPRAGSVRVTMDPWGRGIS